MPIPNTKKSGPGFCLIRDRPHIVFLTAVATVLSLQALEGQNIRYV